MALALPQPSPIRIILSGKRSAFIGPNLITEPYRSAVATVIIGLDNDISVLVGDNESHPTRQQPVSVIPPDTVCTLEAVGDVAVVFSDALRDDCSQIDLRTLHQDIEQLRKRLKVGPHEQLPEVFLSEICHLLGIEPKPESRPEISRVVQAMGERPEDFARVEYAAELAGLSSTRFQHVFSATVGMPFRRYRQWRRMGRVIRLLASSQSLTEVAYACGFANGAHLSTAFKSMFGIRPSMLADYEVQYFLSQTMTPGAQGSD